MGQIDQAKIKDAFLSIAEGFVAKTSNYDAVRGSNVIETLSDDYLYNDSVTIMMGIVTDIINGHYTDEENIARDFLVILDNHKEMYPLAMFAILTIALACVGKTDIERLNTTYRNIVKSKITYPHPPLWIYQEFSEKVCNIIGTRNTIEIKSLT